MRNNKVQDTNQSPAWMRPTPREIAQWREAMIAKILMWPKLPERAIRLCFRQLRKLLVAFGPEFLLVFLVGYFCPINLERSKNFKGIFSHGRNPSRFFKVSNDRPKPPLNPPQRLRRSPIPFAQVMCSRSPRSCWRCLIAWSGRHDPSLGARHRVSAICAAGEIPTAVQRTSAD
jgi:hypothetical protein